MIALDAALRKSNVCPLTHESRGNGGGLRPWVWLRLRAAAGGNWTRMGILQLEGQAIEDDGLSLEVSDVELEAAAGETTHPAMTFPAAPTVSVLVLCCGNDRVA